MKINVSIGGNLMRRLPGSGGLPETLSEQMRRVLARDLTDELRSIIQSERAADPETRRDALERAVRRVWGATQ